MSETPATRAICPKCGATVLENANFCGMCGSSIVAVEPAKDPHLGQVVAGRYRIQSRLAAGGMGEVYVAQHETLSQRVAVKLLHKRFASDEHIVARFFNEARTYCKVKHPNAVTLLDFGRLPDGTLYIVTEFVDGRSLTQMVEQDGPIHPAQAVRIARQLCEALAAAHGEQVVHRDLKPDNIMVTLGPGGRPLVKVLDFGIAKILDETDAPRLTKTGTIFGTPEFMSPEQAQGQPVGFASDLYALGCVLFYTLSGRAPFESSSRADVIQRHVSMAPPLNILRRLEGTPEPLVQLVSDLLEKEPEQRPPDMLTVLSRLEGIGTHIVEPAAPTAAQAKATQRVAPLAATGPTLGDGRASAVELGDIDLSGEQTPAAVPAAFERRGGRAARAVDTAAAGDEAFAFDHGVEPPQADEPYTFAGEGEAEAADPVLGQALDMSPGEQGGAPLQSRGAAFWVLVLLAVGTVGFLAWFLVGRDPGGGGEPAATPDAGQGVGSDLGTGQAAAPPARPQVGPTAMIPTPVAAAPLPARALDVVGAGLEAARAAIYLQAADLEAATAAWRRANQLLGREGETGTGEGTGGLAIGLTAEITRAQELATEAREALAAGQCRRADRAIVEMRQISPALRRLFLGDLDACNRRRDRGQPPRTLE